MNNKNILPAGLAVGAAVYINPETKTVCDGNVAKSTTETKTGCMKWYVYRDNGDGTYQLILDHNTTAVVAYSSIDTILANDIKTWNKSLNARLITLDEITAITKNDWFKGATATSANWWFFDSNAKNQLATSVGESKYSWLFDYTKGCTSNGCSIDDSSTSGYFTSGGKLTWVVNYWGAVDCNSSYLSNSGIRPVITV